MKVLYVSPNGYLGGAENFVVELASNHSKDFKPRILFFSGGEAAQKASRLGVPLKILRTRFRLSKVDQLIRAILEIRSFIKSESPDVIHSTMPYAQIVMSLATLGLKCNHIWFQHGPVGGLLDRIANCFKVDIVCYNSANLLMRHQLMRPLPRTNKEVIIRMGVSGRELTREILTSETITFGAAGRITDWKGLDNIILALKKISESGHRQFKLLVAGSAKTERDTRYLDYLRSFVENSNLKETVEFLNHVDDMTGFYERIDVFIHASTIPEPFGLVAAEAMKANCLVLGSNDGGISEFLQHEKTGLTFHSTQLRAVEELSSALLRIIQSDEVERQRLRHLAKQGQEHIARYHQPHMMRDQIEDLYRELGLIAR